MDNFSDNFIRTILVVYSLALRERMGVVILEKTSYFNPSGICLLEELKTKSCLQWKIRDFSLGDAQR